jgi:hypothetical protein
MKELETLIKALEKEKNQAIECQNLTVAKTDKCYSSYLTGKEEAYTLALMLLREYEKLTSENKN